MAAAAGRAFRPSLFLKVFGSTLVLIVGMGLATLWVASGRVRAEVESDTRERLRVGVDMTYELFRDGLPVGVDADVQARIRALGARTSKRITVLAADGGVVADSHKDPHGMDNHGARPEIVASRTARYGESIRRSDTLDQSMVYVARAVLDEDRVLGYVRTAQPLDQLETRMATLRGTLLHALGIAVLLGLVGALLIARRLAGPLRTMSEAAAAIAQGDFDRRVPITTKDELGDLGQSFNEMAARLQQEVSTIRRDQREMRAILRGMVEGVIAVDNDDRVVLMNDAASEILGISEGDASKKPLWESVRIPAVIASLAHAVEKQRVDTTRIQLRSENGERTVHVHASPLLEEDGSARGAVLVFNDVTERERIEAIRRDFVANASHELKTPLAAARGLIETMQNDEAMPAATRSGFLGRVLKQIGRLSDLVQEMLALSRVESHGATTTAEPIDAVATLRDVVEDVVPLARERDVPLEIDVPADPCAVLAEPEALRRIVGNLLDNAVRYSETGSPVTLRARREAETLVIEVEDRGQGIPPEKQERIFERFYRVDEARSRAVGGTGLGLAIVKHLVHALDGTIELDSTVGRGSTFRVTLKLA